MSGREYQAAALNLPLQNSVGLKCIAVLAVTSSSQVVDLRTLFGKAGDTDSPNWSDGFWTIAADTLPADGKVYVALGPNSAGSISETATGNGATVCWPIADNQSLQGVVLGGQLRSSGVATNIMSPYLYWKGTASGYLRIMRSSSDPGKGAGQFPPP